MERNDALSILEVITKSSDYLARKGVANHKTDAEWLVAHSLDCKRLDLYLRFNEILETNLLTKIKTLVLLRGKRIPLQHILGHVQFAGLNLKSDKRALIPRVETEFLVDYLHHKLSSGFKGRIADLGCGSGAIILGLSSLMPKVYGKGFDISKDALALANENLSLCNMADRISFETFDWKKQSQLVDEYDLIVSNPPYLTHEEWSAAEPEVKNHDPLTSLVASQRGLSDIECVINVATNTLRRNGYFAMEFGADQADYVKDFLSGSFNVEIISDQFLVRRFALAIKK